MKASILKTIRYFDLHNHPLTLMELERYLLRAGETLSFNFVVFLRGVEELVIENAIGAKDGFYFLKGREELIERRMLAYPIYMERLQKTAKLVKILKYVPFVRGIAVGGSLAGMYSNEKSDIDFLVITQPGRIWLARLFLSGATQLLGVRRYGRFVANRVCLNHYVCHGYALPNDHTDYSAIEYNSLLCLTGQASCDSFLKQQSWLGHHLVNDPQAMPDSFYTAAPSKLLQPLLEISINIFGGSFWERLSASYQKKRIQTSPTVTISDQELSFHPDSKGRALLAKFGQRQS